MLTRNSDGCGQESLNFFERGVCHGPEKWHMVITVDDK